MRSAFPRRLGISVFSALVLGGVLFFWLVNQPKTGSWITVYADPRLNVRKAGAYLNERGITVVSEAELWVLLDDFSELRQIPLDLYAEYVEPFDPRNDGYADALRSFFMNDDERRFFVKAAVSASKLEAALRGAVHSGGAALRRVAYSGGGRDRVSFLLFLAAFLCAAVILGRRRFFSLACLFPVFAFVGFWGAAGLAASGFLVTAYCFMETPLNERFRGGTGVSRVLYRSVIKETRGWFRTFPLELFGAFAAMVLYWISSALGSIPLSVSLPACCFFVPLLLLPRWAEAGRIDRRFFPSALRKETPLLVFPPALPVFAAAFAAALGIFFLRGSYGTASGSCAAPTTAPPMSTAAASTASAVPSAGVPENNRGAAFSWPLPPNPERYYRHAAFQSGFSRRSLRGADNVVYGTYSLGGDGLLSGFTELPPQKTFPPYPEILLELAREPQPDAGNFARPPPEPARGLLLLAIMCGLSVPALWGMMRYRKKRRVVV